MSKFFNINSINNTDIISNCVENSDKLDFAKKVIISLQNEILNNIKTDSGPFIAAIYDNKRNLVCKCANSVVNDRCSNCHAEVNAIKKAERIFNTYDLSQFNLSIYVTAEPCMMCLGAIMWSGIKSVYYSVPSNLVEKITGYDEGFKPNWFDEFSKRGITVYGNIEYKLGCEALEAYVKSGNVIYKPKR